MDRSMIQYVLINNTSVPLCIICDQPVELDPLPYAKPKAKILCKKHEKNMGTNEIVLKKKHPRRWGL